MIDMSVKSLSQAIRHRNLSVKEVVTAYLNRIKTVNPELNAVVQLSEQRALDEAAAADEALDRGHINGPLHGIPMTIKDSFDTAGVISAGGTEGRAQYIPAMDATVVRRLREAGAILLGKTNTSELTMTYTTDNLIYGPSNNPYDLSRSPGGSSGGAAAAVAAACSAFDIGSDNGGSLRFPAHCCGLATIKPTSGRVPRTGHILPFGGVLDSFQQVGPLTRYVEDLGFILPIIVGPDYIDPGIIPMALNNPDEVDLAGLKVAFHTNNGIMDPSAETVKAVRDAAAVLDKKCRMVSEECPDGIEQTHDLMIGLLSADGGTSIRRLLKAAGTKRHTLPWLGLSEPVDAVRFDTVIMDWSRFRSTMLTFMKNWDVLLCPVNALPAMPHDGGLELEAFSYTMTYNLTGWPVVVVRAGSSPEGLPIGVQIVAQPCREEIALAVAAEIERSLGGYQAPPDLTPQSTSRTITTR